MQRIIQKPILNAVCLSTQCTALHAYISLSCKCIQFSSPIFKEFQMKKKVKTTHSL